MTKKQIKKEIEDLEFYLGMTRYRRSGLFPGPGIDDEEKALINKINKLKEKLK